MKILPTLLTNRIKIQWNDPTKLAARFAVAKLRFPNDNRWDSFVQLIEKRDIFEELEACLFTKEPDGQWYYLLLPARHMKPLKHYVTSLGENCQAVWYDKPTDLPEYLLLRLFLNTLNRCHNAPVYNLFGTPILFHPTNFGVRGVHPDFALIGINLQLTEDLCLVAQTKTYTRVLSKPQQGERLYELDPARYRLNRYLPDNPFDPERLLYTQKNCQDGKHNIVAQLKLSPNQAINCKLRVVNLFLNELNSRYSDLFTLQFTSITNVKREQSIYTQNLFEAQGSTLKKLTISVEDRLDTIDSSALRQAFQQLIQTNRYHYKEAIRTGRAENYLVWTDDPQQAQLLIQLVPPIDQDIDNAHYLSAYKTIAQSWPNQQIQHVQVKKPIPLNDTQPTAYAMDPVTGKRKKKKQARPAPNPDEIDPQTVLPRLITELTIKHLIAGRYLHTPALIKQFAGWHIGLAKYYTEKRKVIGGLLDIVEDGFLSFYAFGGLLSDHRPTLSRLHGIHIAYTDQDIEQLFQMSEQGGAGPYYYIELPNRKRFRLTDGGEHALPNLSELDRRIASHRQHPSYTYIIEVLQASGMTDIPDFQQLLDIGERCTHVQVQRIADYIQIQLKLPQIAKQLKECVSNGFYNYLKRTEAINACLAGVTDIHWWVEGGDLRYLASISHHLPNLSGGWHLNGLPHVRTIHCIDQADYFDTPVGRDTIPLFIDSLKCGFGRYDAATVNPMPFKILEEWLDLVTLSTVQTHWAAMNSAFQTKAKQTETVKEQDF